MPTSPRNRVTNLKGVVLAGGKSSRFGEDKALARWRGKSLLVRAVDLLRNLHLDPVVIANPKRDYSFLPCSVFNDAIPEKGPIGGLYTACSLFPQNSLLVLTCDMPLLTEAVLKRLIQSHTATSQATIFSFEDQLQPFPGIYGPELKVRLLECLESKELSMKSFLSHLIHKHMVSGISDLKVFQNVNRPEDLNLKARAESPAL